MCVCIIHVKLKSLLWFYEPRFRKKKCQCYYLKSPYAANWGKRGRSAHDFNKIIQTILRITIFN